ncbi:MAG: hypothetical protein GY703_22630 [Gammaproteobacteria bacterium]|nr:hypothetical protein [Gammaproteobacteria bacterium]
MSHLSRLRWLCRRGMKELDLLLLHYLETEYPTADPEQQKAYETLLEMPDPDLYTLITGKTRTDDPQMAQVVKVLRSTLAN